MKTTKSVSMSYRSFCTTKDYRGPPPPKKKYINKNKPSGPLSRSAHDFVLFSIVKLMKTLHNGEDKRKTFYSENQLLSQALEMFLTAHRSTQ